MAPALVEHSAARERNSISKEYRKHCWSKVDLELYKFVQSLKRKTLPLFQRSSSFLEMNDSGKKDKQDISFADDNNDLVAFRNLPIIAFPNLKCITYDTKPGYSNGTLNYKFEKSSPISVITNAESACIFSTKALSSRDHSPKQERYLPRTVNSIPDNAGVVNYLQEKKKLCGVKFSHLSKSIDKLHRRLRLLQSNNVYAHVSTHLLNQNDCENSTNVDDCCIAKKSGVDVEKSWEDLRKLRDMLRLRTDSTDCEQDYETHHDSQYNIKRRKKSDENPPPTDILHRWKTQRASIGSQCSWLSTKISSLDDKISKLDQLHKVCKHKSRDTMKHVNDDNSCQYSDSEGSLEEVCRRTLPFAGHHEHIYVRTKQSTRTPLCTCRCLPTVTPCHRCLYYQRQYSRDSRHERTSRLDGGFHSRLSFKNDVSLSFLLEESLRKQRINMKVTLAKPTKKKKKQKMKEGTGNNELSEKQHAASRKPSGERSCIRSRSERQRYEELSRKRSTGLESGHGGRSRKSRKLSESEESWKPSTPTELNSPFSQNLSSSAFFPLKRKKNSSGASYDINNIVIPYSMAASTRVERIQYKEIPTPGWRNIDRCFSVLGESDEYETTDDEAYTERHTRCEVNEKKKFADCYRHTVIRRRPNHLSESTASGPPSPLVSDEFRPTALSTPIDSPQTVAALLTNRLTNLVLVSGEERESGWPLRTYPLNPIDCAKLSIVTASSVNTPNEWKTACDCDTITTNRLFASTTTSTHSSYGRYFESTTNNSPTVATSPHRTYHHITSEETLPLPTPLYTPVDTPMPSPLSPGCETLLDGDGSVLEPNSWTLKDGALGDVTVDTRQVESYVSRTGIVLELAKQ